MPGQSAKSDAARYICDLAMELKLIADQYNLAVSAYLLDLAAEDAREHVMSTPKREIK